MKHNYQNKLNKACFQHDLAYGNCNNLPWRTSSDKILCDIPFKTASNPKDGKFQGNLTSMVWKRFVKGASGKDVKYEIIRNQEVVGKLHKLSIKKI